MTADIQVLSANSSKRSSDSALIHVSGLTYRYPKRGVVLDEVDFELYEGDCVGLTGPNGAGKTTFLELLVGLKKPKGGDIFAFGNQRKEEADFVEVRAQAGFLFQDPDDQLFCPTVIEDVAFGPLNQGFRRDEAMVIAKDALSKCGMDGYEDRVAYQLSGGEKRMVTLAAVLAMSPKVLLLDEPSNALDSKARQRLISVLNELPQAKIIISHDQDLLDQLINRTLLLEDAKLTETPQPTEAWLA